MGLGDVRSVVSEKAAPGGARLVDTTVRDLKPPVPIDPAERRELRMLKSKLGRDDDPGSQVRMYHEGETHRVGPALYRAFVHDLGVAIPAEEAGGEDDPPIDAGRPGADREAKVRRRRGAA